MSKHWNAALFLAWIALFSGMCHAFGEPQAAGDLPGNRAGDLSTGGGYPALFTGGTPTERATRGDQPSRESLARPSDAELAAGRAALLRSIDGQLGRQAALAANRNAPKAPLSCAAKSSGDLPR